MKKYFVLAIAAMALTFFSCNTSPEAKAEDYIEQMQKALNNGDLEEFGKVAHKCQEWYEGLSKEDQKKVDAILIEKSEDMLNSAANAAKEKIEGTAKDLGGDFEDVAEDLEGAAEDIEDAVEDLEGAAEDLKEALGGLLD